MEKYIEGLQKILTRIETAKTTDNQKSVSEWFIYLQGYIKASEFINFKEDNNYEKNGQTKKRQNKKKN